MPFPESCYLDNSATTRPFDEVIETTAQAMAREWYNPSAAYAAAVAVENAVEAARARLLEALGGRGSLVFASGGTEADNLAIFGAVPSKQARLVTSAVEHPAVARAFEELGARGHEVAVLPADARGIVSVESVEAAVDEATALVSVMHVNNETGAVQDIAALAAAAKRKNPSVTFHSDGVQAFLRVGASPLFTGTGGVDLYTVSAHKVHGPKGVGALFVRSGARIRAASFGGGQENGLRSGTLNAPGILGFGKAVEVFSAHLAEWRAKLMEMKLALAEGLLAIEGAEINGPMPADGAPHILNVSFEGVRGEVLLRALSEQGIFVSTGSACGARQRKPSEVLKAMGLPEKRIESAVRLSLSPMNSMEEIGRAAEAIRTQVGRLRMFIRR
jgi:cysteine desulfurase